MCCSTTCRTLPSILPKSSKCGKAACHFTAAFSAACWPSSLFAWKRGISFLSLGDLTCAAAPIGIFLGRIANFVNGELWGRPDRRAVGDRVSRRRTTCRDIPARFMRRRWKVLLLFMHTGDRDPPGSVAPAGPHHRPVRDHLCDGALVLRNVSRAGSAVGLPVGRLDHGNAALGSPVCSRRRLCRCRAAHGRNSSSK